MVSDEPVTSFPGGELLRAYLPHDPQSGRVEQPLFFFHQTVNDLGVQCMHIRRRVCVNASMERECGPCVGLKRHVRYTIAIESVRGGARVPNL